MPATVTLSSTTLELGVNESAPSIKPTSTSGIINGVHLYFGGELVRVLALQPGGWVKVARGQDGTVGVKHNSLETIWIGRPDQFFRKDPQGKPNDAILVSPHINVQSGKVWFAQGDAAGPGLRWWSEQETTREAGALGVVVKTQSPTSST